MEEEKAAAYYDELTRKGGGAARFKQGLGFTSATSNDAAPSRGSALPSASSFLSSFVKASSPSTTSELEQQAQVESIQNKLKKKPKDNQRTDRFSGDRDIERDSCRRSRSRNRDKHISSTHRSRSRDKKPSRRSRSRSRDRNSRRRSRSRSRDRQSRRRRTRSRSRSRDEYRSRRRSRSRSRSRDRRRRERSRSRSGSELSRRKKRSGSPPKARDWKEEKSGREGKKERNGGGDYAKLIEGYDKMTPAERVKAKMKLQLSETVERDPIKGRGSNWGRFDFDKDAPLDDEEIEAADDDATLVKHIGQSFRFSAVEAKREEQIKVAHDEAMFGAPLPPASEPDEEEREDTKKEANNDAPIAGLISEQVLSMQQGSWRDRVRKT